MELRILGPVEVRDGARRIELAGGKQRVLLAVLALHAGEVVSVDRLIDTLWGDAPPATAPKALQGLVSQLRRALGDGVLETRAPGYVLKLSPSELDAARFEELLADGHNGLAAGDPEAAVATLREALQLWRGPPLAEVAYEAWAQPEIRRLEELRLDALSARIDAELALGRHGSLVAELEELVARNPLDERFRSQLMLALYRSGRQVEALEVYRRGRQALVDELGVEPGPELQRLEQAILRHDEELATPPRAVHRAADGRPRRRISWRIAALVLAGAAVVAAVPAILLGGGDGPPVVVPDSLVRIDPETNEITDVVRVGPWPDRVVIAGRYVFVVVTDDDVVARLDPESGEVRSFATLRAPMGLAVEDDQTVWVGSNAEPEVVRVDVESLRTERHLTLPGIAAVWLAVGGGSLWVTPTPVLTGCPDPVETSRASLRSGQLEGRFQTGRCPISIAFGEGAAWVLNHGDSTVTRIDADDGRTEHYDVGHIAAAVAVGHGSVWVASDNENAVWRLSPQTGRPQAIIPVGTFPWELAVGSDAVWVTNDADGTVSRIDPATNTVVATIAVGFHPHGIAAGPDGVWVAVSRESVRSGVNRAHGHL